MTHRSVLKPEVLKILAPARGQSVLDCTLGLGGHAKAFVDAVGESGTFVGLDADNKNLAEAKKKLDGSHSVHFVHANFSELPQCLPEETQAFDVIFADLGLSSPHLDDQERGFSFKGTSPLDMRFDQSKGMTAAMLLASTDSKKLFEWFRNFGELPRTRSFVDAVIEARSKSPITTSNDLKNIADAVYGYKAPHYLAQIFQALRIAVNDELGALAHLLRTAPSLLSIGGRLGIISYHSLEDRLVKHAFRDLCFTEKDPVTGARKGEAAFTLLTKKGIGPSEEEVKQNPRSRSALFRAVRKEKEYNALRS